MVDNWTRLVEKYDSLIDSIYIGDDGLEYVFVGLLHGSDDYYFVMWHDGVVRFLTCVGTPEQMGFRPLGKKIEGKRWE
jgi:hypothetical protein